MNERGMSFVETILAISILFLLTLTILPVTYQMQLNIQKQIVSYYASEVAYNGALLVAQYGETQGTQQINDVSYKWHYDGQVLCVHYHFNEEAIDRCIS